MRAPRNKNTRKAKKSRRKMRGGNHGSVYIFYHIFCNEETMRVLRDQVTKITYSGLYDAVDQIYCCIVGEEAHIQNVKTFVESLPKKFIIHATGPNDTTYERFTLTKIAPLVKDNDVFLYIHTKGVTRTKNKNNDLTYSETYLWRNYMEHFLIKNYKSCLEKLKEYDVVGVRYSTRLIGPHFSGNFWWSTGKYWTKLTSSVQIGDTYYDPEAYLFKASPKYSWLDKKIRTEQLFPEFSMKIGNAGVDLIE